MELLEEVQQRLQKWWGDWSTSLIREGRGSLRGDLLMCKYLKEGCQEDGPGSSQRSQTTEWEATRRNWNTEALFEHEEELLYCKGPWDQEQIAQIEYGVYFSRKEIIQKLYAHIHKYHWCRETCLCKEVGLHDLKWPLPTLAMWWFFLVPWFPWFFSILSSP